MFRLNCVIKCPINEILLLLPAHYFFCICVLSPHVVHKGKQETSVGSTPCNRTEFDRENHEIQEVMDQEPRRPKLDLNGLWSRPPNLPYGPASPLQCLLASRFVHGQVCGPYVLFSHVILSVSNRIENPLIKQLKT